ncbi:MAG: D-cysteine desulfhydrase family protein [Alphaproteobacteria bacterium]|nr:D-cysteine desulfhydrase family protein [Alphaproteobacteria bacterium]
MSKTDTLARPDRAPGAPGLGCLDDFPRVRFFDAPTPVERLTRLEAALGAGPILVKRDDCQPLAFGGNKTRQLEFYFGAAQAQGSDAVLITGATQSNYCRLAAAFAAKLGMDCHIQLEARVPRSDPAYKRSGNVLLFEMLGATLYDYPHGEDEAGADARLEEIADDLRRNGKTPYVVHLGPGHPPLGALGYAVAAREILEDGLGADEIVVSSGSGATHAGLLTGLRALGDRTPVHGICVRRDAERQRPRLIERCGEIADLMGIPNPVRPEDVIVDDRFLAPGYGRMNPPTAEAIQLAARLEGLLLDPVYTAKSFAGLVDRARTGPGDKTRLYIHTGGLPALFAYADDVREAL